MTRSSISIPRALQTNLVHMRVEAAPAALRVSLRGIITPTQRTGFCRERRGTSSDGLRMRGRKGRLRAKSRLLPTRQQRNSLIFTFNFVDCSWSIDETAGARSETDICVFITAHHVLPRVLPTRAFTRCKPQKMLVRSPFPLVHV
jgi:hypothetical protein